MSAALPSIAWTEPAVYDCTAAMKASHSGKTGTDDRSVYHLHIYVHYPEGGGPLTSTVVLKKEELEEKPDELVFSSSFRTAANGPCTAARQSDEINFYLGMAAAAPGLLLVLCPGRRIPENSKTIICSKTEDIFPAQPWLRRLFLFFP